MMKNGLKHEMGQRILNEKTKENSKVEENKYETENATKME